jgi:flagellar motor protein MotB
MKCKSITVLYILAFVFLIDAHSEVLTWRANAGQQYETQLTVKESIIGLDSTTVKPTLIIKSAPFQEVAARNKSTIPYLQAIPAFPRSAISPGTKWTETGKVTYDISAFGHKDAIVVEVPVSYTFLEMTEIEDRSYYHIQAEWFPNYILPGKIAKKTGLLRLRGASAMNLYWDDKSGCPKRSSMMEEVQYLFDGNASLLLKRETTEEFKTVAEITRELVISELKKQIATQKVANVEVKQTDDGIVLSIENIQFEAESAKLVEAEKAKLTKIGSLLSSLQNRKLNIIGHAANPAGSNEAELLTLSAARAQSVADFLVESGIKAKDSVIATGMGGTKPLAGNDTSEGRTKNRRVEILIMDEETQ